MKIFFDLDGTILDSKERLYELFNYLVPSSKLDFDTYWELKRSKIGHEEILKKKFFYSDEMISDFKSEWMKTIELDQWLSLDKPFRGISEFLETLRSRHSLYLVTARQSNEALLKQLVSLNLHIVFEEIFVTGGLVEKQSLIQEVKSLNGSDWIVGDTGKDIQAGKILGIRTAAVLTGFLNRKALLEYHPDIVVEKACDLKFDEY